MVWGGFNKKKVDDCWKDVMAESRGGKEDMRLKGSFRRLWEKGTDYVAPEQFEEVLTSRELKVRPKSARSEERRVGEECINPWWAYN